MRPALVLKTNTWFNKGEIIFVKQPKPKIRPGAEYVTVKDSKKRNKGYTIGKENIRFLSQEDYPEYFL